MPEGSVLTSTVDPERLDFLAQIATWYYEDGLDQETIARRIDRSRSLVSRLLEEARQAGLVEVRVVYPLKTDTDLSRRLCQRFGLQQALVLADPPEDHNTLLRRLGELGARALQESLHDGAIIGVGWGTGVHAVVRAMPRWPLRDATVVQIIGAVGHGDPLVDGAELARWLADKLGAAYRYLLAPLLVKDELAARVLLDEPAVVQTLNLAARAEVALIGIGAITPGFASLQRAGYLSSTELAELEHAGSVGDVLARPIDRDGNILDVSTRFRCIGLDEQKLRRIPRVIAVAGGIAKAAALRAALRGGYASVLVTDAITSAELLRLDSRNDA